MTNDRLAEDVGITTDEWLRRNTFVRCLDGSFVRGKYLGVHSVKEYTSAAGWLVRTVYENWELESGRIAVCVIPVGRGDAYPAEVRA